MLYNDTYYEQSGYGTSPTGGIPGNLVELNSYQNTLDKVILYWTLEPYSQVIHTLKWEIEIDTVNSFNSPNKQTILIDPSQNNPNYISGYIYKGIIVDLPEKSLYNNIRMYWRVRAKITGDFATDWSIDYFDIEMNYAKYYTDIIMSTLPDMIYRKDEDANIYKLHKSFCQSINDLRENILMMKNGFFLSKISDLDIEKIFGSLLGIRKWDNRLTYLDYREFLKYFVKSIWLAPSVSALTKMLYGIFRNYPTIVRASDNLDFYIDNEEFYVYDDSVNPTVPNPLPGWYNYTYCLDEINEKFLYFIFLKDYRTDEAKEYLKDEHILDFFLRKLLQCNVNIILKFEES